MSKAVFIDFETHPIEAPPEIAAPKPVGVAVAVGNADPEYWPLETAEQIIEAQDFFKMLARGGYCFVGHNIFGFDRHVMSQHMELDLPTHQIADTRLLAAVAAPSAPSLSLKSLVQSELGIVPEEANALRDWLVANGHAKKNQKNWGKHIAKAPPELVGPYAIKDVEYTQRIDSYLSSKVDPGMSDAIRREHALAPILGEMTWRGVRVDRQLLNAYRHNYRIELDRADAEIRGTLGCPDLNIDSNDDLADALERAGKSAGFPKTPTGKRKVDKASIELAVTDERLKHVLRYRNILNTYLGTFIEPWIEQSEQDGRIHPIWDQVRGDAGAGGTRTGRIACHAPNLMNVPKEADFDPPFGYLPLPHLRRCLLPEPGHIWLSADFNGQELRGLAHFVMGALEAAYVKNPKLDLHEHAAELIRQATGKSVDRKQTKIIAFSIIYGAGNNTLAIRLGCTVEEAAALRMAYYAALPGLQEFINDVKLRAQQKLPVRTWGGRLLWAPVDEATGRVKDYALVNYLIQGTCADLTKDAIIVANEKMDADCWMLPTVHDEINVSVPEKNMVPTAKVLHDAMTMERLSVPMTVEMTFGKNWGSLS